VNKHFAHGTLVASAMTGAWRGSPAPLDMSEEELSAATPLLLRTAGAALAWRRVRTSNLAESAGGCELLEAFRFHRLEGARRERDLKCVLSSFRAAGVQPLLVKGWALARYYPERGVRPYGDLDFYNPPDQASDAHAALTAGEPPDCDVELHTEHNFAFDRSIADLFERAERLPLGDLEVLVPCAEDHLRLLCLHMLGHGIWRPLWLCDVAAMMEALPADFDWDRFLWGNPRYAEWVKASLGLAANLLGARFPDAPWLKDAPRLPRWLVPAVLHQWGIGAGSSQHEALRKSLPYLVLRPRLLIQELRVHWQNPIEATVDVGGPFNELPRLPFQVAAALRRIPRLAAGATSRQ
jgi:hypothetical protein